MAVVTHFKKNLLHGDLACSVQDSSKMQQTEERSLARIVLDSAGTGHLCQQRRLLFRFVPVS